MFASCNLFDGVRVIDVWGRGNVFFCEIVGVVVDKIVYKIVVCGVCGGVCVIRRSAVVDKIVYKIVVCRVVLIFIELSIVISSMELSSVFGFGRVV